MKFANLILTILIVLIILIIYLIYNHLKNTEENFNNIIEVHFEEHDIDQTLYKIDLSSSAEPEPEYYLLSIPDTRPFIDVTNIIALFPISNDIVYMLDSTHKLFKVEISSSSASSIEITFTEEEYPVKVVGNNIVVYVLTSEGNVYPIDNTGNLETSSYSDAIDIALTSNGTLYWLNKQGELFISSSIETLSVTDNEKFVQIVGSGNNYIFGLTPNKEIKRISFLEVVTLDSFSHLTSSINIQLISSDSMFGYIDDSNKFYFMENDNEDSLSSTNSHNYVKQASFNESGTNIHRRIVLDNSSNNIKISKEDDSSNTLDEITVRKGTNTLTIQLFAGVNMNNIFVLANRIGTTITTRVPPQEAVVNCPDCNICTETTFNECDSIWVAIKGLIDPSSINCNP